MTDPTPLRSPAPADASGLAGQSVQRLAESDVDPEIEGEIAFNEKMAIVAFLRQQSDLGAEFGLDSEKGTTRRAAYGGGSLALKRAADAIEQDEHIAARSALDTRPTSTSAGDVREATILARDILGRHGDDHEIETITIGGLRKLARAVLTSTPTSDQSALLEALRIIRDDWEARKAAAEWSGCAVGTVDDLLTGLIGHYERARAALGDQP